MKKVFLALFFVFFSISVSYASLPTPTEIFDLNPFAGDYYDEVSVDPGMFVHEYIFTIGNSDVETFAEFWNVTKRTTGEVFRDIDNFSFSIFSDDGLVVAKDGNEYLDYNNYFSAGTYSLFVSGTAVGTKGGIYAASINAVPIPGAALLLGSALIGLVGVRRRKTV